MKVGSLFSGIGGFDLGLERAGMEIAWQVEIDPFCNKVLAKYWPNVKRYGDIKDVAGVEPVDLICGGFPCQPFSCAGKRKGAEDDRALWPEMLRVIQESKPRWIIGENVAGIIGMELDNYISDLEREGYTIQTFVIPACAVNAPHRRDRVWIVVNSGDENKKQRTECGAECSGCHCHAPNSHRFNGNDAGFSSGEVSQQQKAEIFRGEPSADTINQRLPGCERPGSHEQGRAAHGSITERNHTWDEDWITVALRTCVRNLDDGIPGRLAGRNRVVKLKALGNAVVPQIVEIIGRVIMEIET